MPLLAVLSTAISAEFDDLALRIKASFNHRLILVVCVPLLQEDRIVFLSNVWLDRPETFEALHTLLSGESSRHWHCQHAQHELHPCSLLYLSAPSIILFLIRFVTTYVRGIKNVPAGCASVCSSFLVPLITVQWQSCASMLLYMLQDASTTGQAVWLHCCAPTMLP